jgi:hypothetical protein
LETLVFFKVCEDALCPQTRERLRANGDDWDTGDVEDTGDRLNSEGSGCRDVAYRVSAPSYASGLHGVIHINTFGVCVCLFLPFRSFFINRNPVFLSVAVKMAPLFSGPTIVSTSDVKEILYLIYSVLLKRML